MEEMVGIFQSEYGWKLAVTDSLKKMSKLLIDNMDQT